MRVRKDILGAAYLSQAKRDEQHEQAADLYTSREPRMSTHPNCLNMREVRTFHPQNNPSGPPENRPVWNALLMPVRIPIAQNEMPSTPNSDISRRNSALYPSSRRRSSDTALAGASLSPTAATEGALGDLARDSMSATLMMNVRVLRLRRRDRQEVVVPRTRLEKAADRRNQQARDQE